MSAPSAHEDAIRRLAAFYSDAVNHHDHVRAASVYAPDGRLQMFEGPEFIGRDAVQEAMRQTFAAFSFMHQSCHSGLVDVSGAEARGRWSIFELSSKVDSTAISLFAGAYEDELVLLDDVWRFKRRRITVRMRSQIDAEKLKVLPAIPPEFAFLV